MSRKAIFALILTIALPFFGTGFAAHLDDEGQDAFMYAPIDAEGASEKASALYKDAQEAVKSKQYQKAADLLKEAAAIDPSIADLWSLYGFALRKDGHFKKAKQAYVNALRINPEHKNTLEYLGELYLQTDQLKNAQIQARRLKNICGAQCPQFLQLQKAIAEFKNR